MRCLLRILGCRRSRFSVSSFFQISPLRAHLRRASCDGKLTLVVVVIGSTGVVRSENTQSSGYRHAPGDPTAIQEPAPLKRPKTRQRHAGGLGLDQMRLGVLCADPPSPLRCAPCNYVDRRLHFTGRGCGLSHHRCKVRHPRPNWKVLAVLLLEVAQHHSLILNRAGLLVEARCHAQPRRLLFSTLRN